MSRGRTFRVGAVVLLATLVAGGDALAQRTPKPSEGGACCRPTGLRVTVTNVDIWTLEVEFDVTLNTVYATTVPPNAGLLGNYLFTTFSSATGTLLNPVVVAIYYGDSNTITQTTIPGAGGNYVGSFTHTYPGPGIYPLTVGASGFIGTNALSTGNPVITPSPVPTTGPFGTTGLFIVGSYIAGGTPITYNIIASTPNFAMGVTNTPGSNQPYPPATGGGLNIPIDIIIENPIPTVSEVGLVLLALLLAGGGVILLRR